MRSGVACGVVRAEWRLVEWAVRSGVACEVECGVEWLVKWGVRSGVACGVGSAEWSGLWSGVWFVCGVGSGTCRCSAAEWECGVERSGVACGVVRAEWSGLWSGQCGVEWLVKWSVE